MFVKISCVFLMAAAFSLGSTIAQDQDSAAVRIVYKIYDECFRSEGGITPCLKKKAITFIDRVSKVESLPVSDGVSILKSGEVPIAPVASEAELEKSLPRGLEAQDQVLNNMLIDRVAAFLSSRTLKLSLPSMTSQELSRSIEEGRGKMKKMMGMMMAGFAMKMAALVPIAIAGLFLLAGKALITAKIALLLAGIIGLKKLLSQKQGHESHGGGWQSSGGWDRRSLDAAQDLAYRGYVSQ